MITTKFEDTYSSVAIAKKYTKYVADVVDFLSKQTEQLTCKEIGVGIFGEAYTNSYVARSYSARLGQVLSHLREGGFVTVEERLGDPIEIETREWIIEDSNGVPLTIYVYDDKGNTYEIPNPKASLRDTRHGHWGTVKKTIFPKIKFYKWVG